MDEKTIQAKEQFAKAERKTKRRWKKGWTKPNLIKAAQTFTQTGLLAMQTNDLETAKKCLFRAYECYKSKRAWYEAGKTLEQIGNVQLLNSLHESFCTQLFYDRTKPEFYLHPKKS